MPAKTTRKPVRKPAKAAAKRPVARKRSSAKKHPIHKRVYHAVRMRIKRNGFIRPKVVPILAATSVAAIGVYFLAFSKAATPSTTFSGFSQQAAVRSADGRIHMFVLGTDKAVYFTSQKTINAADQWNGFTSIGGQVTSGITVIANQDGRIQVFARGTDNALWTNYQSTTSGGFQASWIKIGGTITSDPTVTKSPDGRINVFARGTNNEAYVTSQKTVNVSNSWNGFTALGGQLTSNITAVTPADGKMLIFGRGADNATYVNGQLSPNTGSFGGWIKLGGNVTSEIAAVVGSDSKARIFARGTDNAVFVNTQTVAGNQSAWSGFSRMESSLTSNPSVALNTDGSVQVTARGTDNAMYSAKTGSGFAKIGGNFTSEPVSMANANGRVQIFGLGTDNAVYTAVQVNPSQGFGPLVKIGGTVAATSAAPAASTPAAPRQVTTNGPGYTAPSPSSLFDCAGANKTVTLGSNDPCVTPVEAVLIRDGHLGGAADTVYNQATADAAIAYRNKWKIGVVGDYSVDACVMRHMAGIGNQNPATCNRPATASGSSGQMVALTGRVPAPPAVGQPIPTSVPGFIPAPERALQSGNLNVRNVIFNKEVTTTYTTNINLQRFRYLVCMRNSSVTGNIYLQQRPVFQNGYLNRNVTQCRVAKIDGVGRVSTDYKASCSDTSCSGITYFQEQYK